MKRLHKRIISIIIGILLVPIMLMLSQNRLETNDFDFKIKAINKGMLRGHRIVNVVPHGHRLVPRPLIIYH